MATRVLILGAGFGGLEISTRLSEEFGEDIDVTLIDKNEAFVFGFAKFDVLFGHKTLPEVQAYYHDIVKPGVTFRQETVTSIDPVAKRVATSGGRYEADVLVVALGAEYDYSRPPGFTDGGHEFYSIDGTVRLREILPTITSGTIVIAVLGEPFKCPPAPCEAAMLLDEYFSGRGVRNDIEISVVSPWGRPIPPSPDGSKAILGRFAERGIGWQPQTLVTSIDPETKTASLRDGGTLPYDLFLGIPIHRAPTVVEESGLTENGWVPVDRGLLTTRFPDVYAVGDVTSVGVPKAGVFAEGAGRVVAEQIIAKMRGGGGPEPYGGLASCYVEFGDKLVGRVDADFSGPQPTGPFTGPSLETAEEKSEFASSRRRRWFGYAS